MLAQPYCPPPMIFEKKFAAPVERVVLTKAANVTVHNKQQTLKLVKDAIKIKTEQTEQQLASKDALIQRQQDILIDQQRKLHELQAKQVHITQDPNIIQINDLQKIRGLDVQDRYNVLEMLVKELVGLRQDEELSKQTMMQIQMQQMIQEAFA